MKKTMLAAAVCAASLSGLVSLPAYSHEAGDWIVRVGAASVNPDESSGLISTAATGPLAGTGAGVGNSTQLGLNFVYMWSDKLGIELLLATPFEHDLEAKGLPLHGFDTRKLGSAKHLPPTLTAEYFLLDPQSAFQPYVGIGINYTTFFSEDLTGFAKNELAARSLDLDDSWGVSWRAGFDWELDDTWMLNASVWKIDLETEASFNSALGKVKVNVDVDPWVYMVSIGYKF
ncbi:MAG: outer membrane beta-barrel protein [Gammaproteobacteria bacterium]|nr:outer membrane beta-barrel protein [Gammaproteobacteria bacterium]